MRRHRSTARPMVMIVSAVLLLSFADATAGETDKAVAQIIAKINDTDSIWRQSSALADLGPDAADSIRKALPEAKPKARLACARALCALGDLEGGVAELRKFVEQPPEKSMALYAAKLLGQFGKMTSEVAISELLDSTETPRVKVELARALHSAATNEKAIKKATSTLRELFKADDRTVREDAALALAEIGQIDGDVQLVLLQLRSEPTDRGALARSLLRVQSLQELAHERYAKSKGLREPLLNEIISKARSFHVEEPKEFKEYRNGAAKGIASQLDPFTSYFTKKDLKKFRESMTGEYAGIGAHVGYPGIGTDLTDRVFTVIRPIYTGPAYETGLRSYDEIIKVEGKPTENRETEDLVKELRGKVGTPVNITVRRPGVEGTRDYTITRRKIQLPTVSKAMLPGKVGYIKLGSFGEKSTKEFEAALVELEKDGARGIIFDLRDNLGGLLSAARDIADKFLKDDKLIVSSHGRSLMMAPHEELRTRDEQTHPDYPLVVLVNKRSASASEIVSGALQDHKRAVLIGTRTYGKGSVQKVLPVRHAGGRAALKLTVAKYYLPSGRCIHRDPPAERGGVMPDIEVFRDSLVEPHKLNDFELLRTSGAMDNYWKKHYKKSPDLLAELARFDAHKYEKYPGFEKWFQSLEGRYDRDTARRALRTWARVKLADERGKMFVHDFENDSQLQRAVMELALKTGFDPEQFPQYKGLMAKFKLKPRKAAALLNEK